MPVGPLGPRSRSRRDPLNPTDGTLARRGCRSSFRANLHLGLDENSRWSCNSEHSSGRGRPGGGAPPWRSDSRSRRRTSRPTRPRSTPSSWRSCSPRPPGPWVGPSSPRRATALDDPPGSCVRAGVPSTAGPAAAGGGSGSTPDDPSRWRAHLRVSAPEPQLRVGTPTTDVRPDAASTSPAVRRVPSRSRSTDAGLSRSGARRGGSRCGTGGRPRPAAPGTARRGAPAASGPRSARRRRRRTARTPRC